MFLIPATFSISVNMATPLVEIAIAQAQPAPTNQVGAPVSAFIAASFNLTSQPLLIPIESGFSGGGAQLQAFAEAGSYWLDSVTTSPLFVAETGSYWLDSVELPPVFVAETGSYWLDSVDAAIAESGSYWLDSAVASPMFVAESGVYWLDSVEAAIAESGSYWLDSVAIVNNRGTFNSIIYTPTSTATNYFTGSPASVNDGFTTGAGNQGMIYNGGNSFPLTITSSSAFYWNRFTIYGGQFNGNYNCPGRISIYAADGTTLLYQGALFAANTLTPLTQELGGVSGLDTPRSVYQVVFDQPPDNANSISIFELQIFGS